MSINTAPVESNGIKKEYSTDYFVARLRSNMLTTVILAAITAALVVTYVLFQNIENSDYFFIIPALFTGLFSLFSLTVRRDIKGFMHASMQEVETISMNAQSLSQVETATVKSEQ